MKLHGYLILLFAFTSCEPQDDINQNVAQQEVKAKIPDKLPAPVLASRNWSAQVIDAQGKRTLLVTGEVDLPTPGYQVSGKHGPMDRMQPPGVRMDGVAMHM